MQKCNWSEVLHFILRRTPLPFEAVADIVTLKPPHASTSVHIIHHHSSSCIICHLSTWPHQRCCIRGCASISIHIIIYHLSCIIRHLSTWPHQRCCIRGCASISFPHHPSFILTRTGALVLDRINGVAYVDVSERADIRLAEKWASELGYKDLVTFRCVCVLTSVCLQVCV